MFNFELITKPILPIYLINWIFGIGVFEYPLGYPRPILSLIYSLTCTLIYCALSRFSYSKILDWSVITANKKEPLIFLFYLNIFLVIGVSVFGWRNSKGMRDCVKNLGIADGLMEHMGIEKNYDKMFKMQMKNVLLSLVYIIILLAIDIIIALPQDEPIYVKLLTILVLCYPVIITFIADLTIVGSIRCICFRFDCLNVGLKNYLNYPQNEESTIYLRRNDADVINTAKRVHLQLVKVCQETNSTFGLELLISIAVAVVIITGHLYNSYVLIHYSNVPQTFIFKAIISSVLWIFHYVIKIYCVTWICNSCKEKAVKTGDLINELYDDPSISSDAQNQIRYFNVQLIQKPVNFTAYGFVTVDYTLIQLIAGTITTYLMILIQLGKMYQ